MLGQRSSADDLGPYLINWSPESYGPDGPWHAVRVSIGHPAQQVDLLLGRIRVSAPLAPESCDAGMVCPPRSPGYYILEKSTSATPPARKDIQHIKDTVFAPGGGFYGPSTTTGQVNPVSDTLRLFTASGPPLEIPRSGIEVLKNTRVHVPYVISKGQYPMSIGFLTIGAPSRAAYLALGPPAWPQNNYPQYLFNIRKITSPSITFHIGSPSLGITPSLVLGGYDQRRILGTVLSQQLDSTFRWKINLTDIGIGTEFGHSPFEGGSQSGLLTEFSDGGNSLVADVIVQQPYLFLPRSTCDAIARHLPVSFHNSYGVYLWHVNDPQFQKIMSTPSFLYFKIKPYSTVASPIGHHITIKVPFNLLNLTLESPITTEPMSYFPCAPPPRGTDSQDEFGLGRAFLQAATVGVNWGTTPDVAGYWWISQAPGPNVLTPRINSVVVGQRSILDNGDGWGHSWMAFWNRFNPTPTGPGPSPSPTKGGEPSGGLSTGAKAGIGAGVGVLGILLLGLAFICFRRRQRQRRHQALNSASSPGMTYIRDESSPEISPTEAQNDTPTVHELPTPEDERQFYATFPDERRQFNAPYPRPYPFRQMQLPPMQNITTQYATVHDDRDNIISPLSPSPLSPSPWSATTAAEPMSAALQPPPPAYPELDNERAAEMDADRGAELEAPRQVEKSGFLVA